MNETNGPPKDEYSDPDAPEDLVPLTPLSNIEKPETKTPEPKEDTDPSQNLKNNADKPMFPGVAWIKRKASDVGLHDWLMVIFTGVLTWVAVQQFRFAKENAITATEQVNQIIQAANRTEDAADSFSGSAAHINAGVSDAVKKLNEQAAATGRLATAEIQQMKGLQAAVVTMGVMVSIRDTIEMQINTGNSGHLIAKKVSAHAWITIREWPSKKTLAGPFFHPFYKPALSPNVPSSPSTPPEPYEIPGVTPEILKAVKNGRAYVEIKWNGSYDDGFKDKIDISPTTLCQAWMEVAPPLQCVQGNRGFPLNAVSCQDIADQFTQQIQERKTYIEQNQNCVERPN